MSVTDFWKDQETAQEVVTELKSLKAIVGPISHLVGRIEDVVALHELAVEASCDDTLAEAAAGVE